MKHRVLAAAKLLQGSNISISQDYSKEVREKRKILYPYLKKARAENVPAKMINDKLIIAGQVYDISNIKQKKSSEDKPLKADTKKRKISKQKTPKKIPLHQSHSQESIKKWISSQKENNSDDKSDPSD